MQITSFLHAAIVVADLERAKHFYGTILGLHQVDRNLKFSGVWYQIGEFQIHLITATVPEHIVNHDKWGRNRHLAFGVTDLDAVKELFLSQGYPFQMSASGRAALFVKDPDDNIIELNQL